MKPLSIVLMTYNEESRLSRCLDAVAGLWDELLVVDSFSTDETLSIARQYNARIIQHSWEGYIKQRAFCVENANYDHVLALDADEVVSANLKNEILNVKHSWKSNCYRFKRLEYYENKPIRFGGLRPSYKLRLFNRRHATCSGKPPHDSIIANPGSITANLKGLLHHHSGLTKDSYQEKIQSFARTRAEYLFSTGERPSTAKAVFKPFLRFLSAYLYKAGILEGKRGYDLARLEAEEVWLRYKYLRELINKR